MAHDTSTNRSTLHATEFTESQPKLVTSEKSLPVIDLGQPMHVNTEPITIPRRGGRSTPCSSPMANSPGGTQRLFGLSVPSPIITKKTRSASTCERAMDNPIEKGKIRYFCRTKGHGFVKPDGGGEDVFLHISDIEGEYVPREGDEVTFRLCPIPPKLEKFQAIACRIINFTEDVHLRWDAPVEDSEKNHDRVAENASDKLVT